MWLLIAFLLHDPKNWFMILGSLFLNFYYQDEIWMDFSFSLIYHPHFFFLLSNLNLGLCCCVRGDRHLRLHHLTVNNCSETEDQNRNDTVEPNAVSCKEMVMTEVERPMKLVERFVLFV